MRDNKMRSKIKKKAGASLSNYKTEIIVSLISVIASVIISQILLPINLRIQSRQDAKTELFVREAPILNRIHSIWDESSITHLVSITTAEVIQPKLYLYVDEHGNIVKRDTVTNTTYRNDTSEVDIPTFAYSASAACIVMDDISFIKSHTDLLSPDMYTSIKALINFFDTHSINTGADESVGVDSTWIDSNVQKEYYKIISGIYSTYLQKERDFK